MNTAEGRYTEKLIARRYEDLGYEVIVDPDASMIPFSLGQYRPDILATKGDEHLLIDVKSPRRRPDPDAYMGLDRDVRAHAGWRLLLVTVSEEEMEAARSAPQNVTLEALRQSVDQLDGAANSHVPAKLLLPQLWLAYVSALRLLVQEDGPESKRLTDMSVINRAYAEGSLSIGEFESSRRLLKVRNDLIHKLDATAEEADCLELRALIEVAVHRIDDPETPR